MTQAKPDRHFFQIGFNKCATTSFYALFRHARGVKPLHSSGREWRLKGHPSIRRRHPQITIARNIEAGKAPLETLDDFDAFFDMEFVRGDTQIENFRNFAALAEAYPDAKFLLNTRDKAAWIRSRLRHADGEYLEHAQARTGLDTEQVIAQWGEEFDAHIAEVQAYFADQPGRLLVFDIDEDDIDKLIAFAAPDFKLSAEDWTYQRVTDRIAEKRGWEDDLAAVGTDEIKDILGES